MKFLIVTGISGAGKTQAIRALEDIGYFCVDNLPPALLPKFADICFEAGGKLKRVAIVADIRGGRFFNDLFESLKKLEAMGNEYDILFLDASDEVLVKRYKESRRAHPLLMNGRITSAIHNEREIMKPVRSKADRIIDTTSMTGKQLREEIQSIFSNGKKANNLMITVVSFGFKYGIPLDADMVFDVRFLPNPYYVDELKKHSGNDEEVRNFVFKSPDTQKFLDKVDDMLEFLIPNYIKEGKAQLVIGIGCTGGRHRSVALANEIYESLKRNGHTVFINHRDISEDIRGGK